MIYPLIQLLRNYGNEKTFLKAFFAEYEPNWSVILESVSCQCSATWKWIKEKTCGEIPENEKSLELQAAGCISHSLPELQRELEDSFDYVPDNNNVTKKVSLKINIVEERSNKKEQNHGNNKF